MKSKTAGEGFPLFQYLAMLAGSLNIICSGMHYGWPSPSLPKLLADNSTVLVSNEEGSWMAVMTLIGALCGSVMGAVILHLIGRKRVALISSFPFLAAWIMIAYAKSAFFLIAARFLAGIADGLAFSSIPMYLGEISDPRFRGSIGSSVSVTWILGTLLINVIGSYLSISTTALLSSIVPVMFLLTFCWMPESPYYLIMRGDFKQAKRSLQIFKCSVNVDLELERLTKAVKEQTENTGKYLDLFTVKSNRKALFVMLVLRGTQQLSGTSAITFYAQTIFQEAGNIISSTDASHIYFGVQLIMCCCCSLIVDRIGRRPLLIISVIGSGLALFVEGLYFYFLNSTGIDVSNFSWVPLAALIAFVIIFSVGMQSIPILMLGELFQTNVKAFALSLADFYFSIIATLASKFFQITKDEYGLHVPFFAFTICCSLGLVLITLYVPETKGKTLEEIQDNFRGKPKDAAAAEELPETFRKCNEA